ncbi:hypothetical protein [Candidatus Bandiella euplotis]|uniref:hypothetical protein n=1 Tax=Candidatus Bandiella euplotis TaxID=1664265 RepID=UPI003898E986
MIYVITIIFYYKIKNYKLIMHYLKSTIKAEPLIWRWYAWPQLLPPVNAGCNIIERHLKRGVLP